MDLPVEYPEHETPFLWHLPELCPKKQGEKAWLLWYNLSGISSYGSSAFPRGTGFGPRCPTCALLLGVGRWTSVHTSAGVVLGFLSAALWAFENMSFNEVNLTTQFYRQPSYLLIRLDQNLNPYPLSRGISMPELAQGAEFLLFCFQVCIRFIYPELLQI